MPLPNVLVVLSDQTRNLEYKRSPHDASIRIPLVLSGPGFRGGVRRRDLATNLDLVPTLVHAGGGGDPGLDGRPLQSDVACPADLLVQISESQIGRALRTPTHTYAVRAPTRNPLAGHRRPNAERYIETHCYDNVHDPHQLTNLAGMPETADLRRNLAATLAARIREVEMVEPTIATA